MPGMRINRSALALTALNLLAMLIARKVMGGSTLMVLRIVGAVLGVLQVALAVEMLLKSFRELGVMNG